VQDRENLEDSEIKEGPNRRIYNTHVDPTRNKKAMLSQGNRAMTL